MELLCLAHDGTPQGYVTVNGRAATMKQIASVAGCGEKEAAKLTAELEAAGVFSRTTEGVIYSRRMVRDATRSEEGREHVAKRWNGHADPNTPPNRSPTSHPTIPPIRQPSGGPITLEADSESEAESKKVSLNKNLLNESEPARVPEIAPSEAEIAAARAEAAAELRSAGRPGGVALHLGGRLRNFEGPPGRKPNQTHQQALEKALAAVPKWQPVSLNDEQLRVVREQARANLARRAAA
jgi:hypothetical protein